MYRILGCLLLLCSASAQAQRAPTPPSAVWEFKGPNGSECSVFVTPTGRVIAVSALAHDFARTSTEPRMGWWAENLPAFLAGERFYIKERGSRPAFTRVLDEHNTWGRECGPQPR